MAPTTAEFEPTVKQQGKTKIEGEIDYVKLAINEEIRKKYGDKDSYKHLIPKTPQPIEWPVLEKVEIPQDKALLADPNTKFEKLYKDATLVKHLGPRIGTEIHGVSLNQLDDDQKNELALLLTNRHVLIFREQKDFTLDQQLDLFRYFGPLHRHHVNQYPEIEGRSYDEVALIKSGFSFKSGDPKWHSDATFELQPPAYTALHVVEAPSVGSDTHFASSYALYDFLSPALREYLSEHTAIHSDIDLYNTGVTLGLHPRRKPIETEHPIIRTHPITGFQALFVNRNFTKRIVGVPPAESNAILEYLFKITESLQEHKVRIKWEPNTVVVWDNRGAIHAGTDDYYPQYRIGSRTTAIGDSPIYDPNGKSEQEFIDEKVKIAVEKFHQEND